MSTATIPNGSPHPNTLPGEDSVGRVSSEGRRRYLIKVAGVIFAVVLAGYVAHLVVHAWHYESTDDAFIEAHVVSISPRVNGHVARVLVNDNQYVKQGDLLVELDSADYETGLNGAKAALDAARARLAQAEFNLQLTQVAARTEIQQAASGVDAAESATHSGQALIESARQNLAQARAATKAAEAEHARISAEALSAAAEAQRAETDNARYGELRGTGAVAKTELDRVEATARQAQAALDAARQGVAAAQAKIIVARAGESAAQAVLDQAVARKAELEAERKVEEGKLAGVNVETKRIGLSQAELAMRQAECAAAEATLSQAELDLSYTRITAPVSGHVTKKSVEAGSWVQSGQSLLAVVPEERWIVANFKESQLTHMQPGQPVEVRVDAFPGLNLIGRVESIQRGTGSRFSLLPPENASGNFVKVVQRVPVKIDFDNPEEIDRLNRLAPGLSVIPDVRVRP